MPTKETINYSLLPSHMQEGMKAYMEIGRPTGDFLFHILSNNFVAASYHADDINQHQLFSYCNFLYNECHPLSWGKEETVWAWMKHHGFIGLEVKEGVEYCIGILVNNEPYEMVTENGNRLKECFEYTPNVVEDKAYDITYCIFCHVKEEIEEVTCIRTFKHIKLKTEPLYHWISKSKAWFPGPPWKEQEKSQ